ncbi:Fujikurins efflux protein [Lachnellula suecica]|uniref:Fujikurins efflux protein n=1 Tax=Lachnellula suecica TaxID=602035 RepID=A0A8T9BZI7_9HELO|nr:Fujikurins efflux protein [Lachnellula suecica]
MASMDSTDNNTPVHRLQTDPEKAGQADSNFSGDVETSPKEVKEVEDVGPPMDGGTAAWLNVLGAWCCSFSSPGWANSSSDEVCLLTNGMISHSGVGSFQQYYEIGPLKGYSNSTISWIPALQLFFLFALGPFIGLIYDRYGPRPLILGGTIFHVFGLMMASLATEYYQFMLSQGVCSAIGVACLYMPAIACVSTWFNKKRGLAMGILVTGSSVGGVIFPIMISHMVSSSGYPWTIRTAAFIILGLQIIAILTIRPRTKPVPKKMPVGRLGAPFLELNFVLLLLGVGVLTYGIFTPIVYLAVQGFQEAHMSEEMSQYLIAIFNAARITLTSIPPSLFGRLISGYFADKIGKWNMFIIACAVSGIAIFALWIPAKHSSIAIGFAIMFGFTSGAFMSLSSVLPIAVSPLPEIGYRMGLVLLAISIPALTVAPICGAILQGGGDAWLNVKIFGGVFCLAGACIILLSRWLYTDRKLIKVF